MIFYCTPSHFQESVDNKQQFCEFEAAWTQGETLSYNATNKKNPNKNKNFPRKIYFGRKKIFEKFVGPKKIGKSRNFENIDFSLEKRFFEFSKISTFRHFKNFRILVRIPSMKIFSTKIKFPRKIFVFIEKFCIRPVIRKCFSLRPGDLKVVKLLFVDHHFLKMYRVTVKYQGFWYTFKKPDL